MSVNNTQQNCCIVSGSSNPKLAQEIANVVRRELTPVQIRSFADGEIWCQIQESVRGTDVFIIQSTCTPVNDNLMELFLLIDACKRASAKSITAIVPYYGYARQDRKTKSRVPISAALVAKLLESSGVDRLCSIDLHCGQIQGFFRIPVDNLFGQQLLAEAIHKDFGDQLKNVIVVSPDAGGAERADYFRKRLKIVGISAGMAIMNKKRVEHNQIHTMELIGNVKDCDCVIVDDMIDTAGTLCLAAKKLHDAGANRVFACASHGLLNGLGTQRIAESVLQKVYILNTVPLTEQKKHEKISEVSVANLLASVIDRIDSGESVSSLFD